MQPFHTMNILQDEISLHLDGQKNISQNNVLLVCMLKIIMCQPLIVSDREEWWFYKQIGLILNDKIVCRNMIRAESYAD